MGRLLKTLEPPDDFYLKAAEGWLELGNWLEANEELERSQHNRTHQITQRNRTRMTIFLTRFLALIGYGDTVVES
jgi:hypothetical protein